MNEIILQRQKRAAEMLLKGDFPVDILISMKALFDEASFVTADKQSEKYRQIQDIACVHDRSKREDLDAKITMFPNPNFSEEIDVDKVNDQIAKKFLDMLSQSSVDNLTEEGEVILSKNDLDAFFSDAKPIDEAGNELPPVAKPDDNARFLFRVEGIEGVFDSAAKAIQAYKIKNGTQPQFGQHSFRRTLVTIEEDEVGELDSLGDFFEDSDNE